MLLLWWMRIRPLYLHKAFRADRLIAAPSSVQIWRVIHKADWALLSIFIQKGLNGLTIYV